MDELKPEMGNTKKAKQQSTKRKSDGKANELNDVHNKRRRGQAQLEQWLPLEHNQNKATRSSENHSINSPMVKRGQRRSNPSPKLMKGKSPKKFYVDRQDLTSNSDANQESANSFEQSENQSNEEAHAINNDGVDVMINASDDEFAEELNQQTNMVKETPKRGRQKGSRSRSRSIPTQDVNPTTPEQGS